ncbi:MAG: single-stranded DNA-binding protein [Candidatus Colwellbacteria bacterium CG10_big_fil_rev_8_21_14_0_10_42_22]|uniref:Single-stranded DNA-binding protein n=1 Tax=Candidatus Colwellbacteria bacterium CG10_big_fil_rev_8_21_14_0_10_42_22 TaxID=1974540 RepID=A0A2H0VFY8_9BACT|nr:MAG: single-stranded DNA-binding protein [Candidatus Colwellbacteria bacterium CG10_big_fil_rev_8_21_14_0_10_42_22]
MNLNKVIIAGRLTADPELRTTSSGDSVASFSLATNRFWRDKNGEKKENTEFHNIVAWGRQAEIINQFSKKGSILMVEGRLQTRTWEGKDGQNRRTTEIVAENIQLGPRSGGQDNSSFDQTNTKSYQSGGDAQESAREEVPTIDVDQEDGSEEIKAEDLPF